MKKDELLNNLKGLNNKVLNSELKHILDGLPQEVLSDGGVK